MFVSRANKRKRDRTFSIGSGNATPLTKLVLSWFLLSTMTYPHKFNYFQRILLGYYRLVRKLCDDSSSFSLSSSSSSSTHLSVSCHVLLQFCLYHLQSSDTSHQSPAIIPWFRIECVKVMNLFFPSFVWLSCLDLSNENFVTLLDHPYSEQCMNCHPLFVSEMFYLVAISVDKIYGCELWNSEIVKMQNVKPYLILRIWIASHFNIFYLENYVSSLTLQCLNEIQQLKVSQ